MGVGANSSEKVKQRSGRKENSALGWLRLRNDDFAVRQKANDELGKRGDAIASALRGALQGKPSLETRRRVQQLLDQSRDWTPERLRVHRAIQALERIGTRTAREVLQMLATGAPEARCAEEAKVDDATENRRSDSLTESRDREEWSGV